jgi:cytochrome c oxidase subunit 2
MSISPPERIWWKPLHTEEKVWLALALIFTLSTFFFMPIWHVIGSQNPPSESYKVSPAQFRDRVSAFVEQYVLKDEAGEEREEKGIPIVHPPPGSDVYLMAQSFMWYPILELEKGKTYRVHLSSVDVEHGLSVYPLNMNFMALPDYDYVLTITPTEAGEYPIFCNEFCGIGHHRMVGKMIVKE